MKNVQDYTERLLNVNGDKTPQFFHRELGKIMWEYCGMSRTLEGLNKAIDMIQELRKDFWEQVRVPGDCKDINQALEQAGRISDFIELGELMCKDALNREESCGGHFREEYQTENNEALRNDEDYSYTAVWEFKGLDKEHELHKEPLTFDYVKLAQRNYK